MFKIAYCAGHHLGNPKGIPLSMGLGDIREWTLNDRVARHFAQAAAKYPQVELLRTDDPSGQRLIDIPQRTAAANDWGADLYLDIHHNGGINGGYGGGVVIFSYPGSAPGRQYRDGIYDAVRAAGGLRGDRAQPRQEVAFDSLRLTHMPAVLAEYGFMDSRTDAPVILTDVYAKLVAEATMAGIAKVAGLKKAEQAREDFVRAVQKAIGATADGIPGPKTLGATPTVSMFKNPTHPVVRVIQQRLLALGYPQVGQADGIAGKKFDAGVKTFQQDNGCVVDGELTAGSKTWRKLLGM